MQDDRTRLAELMGEEVLDPIPVSDPHGFWMYNIYWDYPVYVDQLRINGERKDDLSTKQRYEKLELNKR